MASMTVITDDSTSRNLIVSDLNQNFFVEAGAGSGKTTMLVNRMVALIESGVPVDKICAITFTKAAAAEFYKRFQELLSERSVVDPAYKLKGHAGELPVPTKETAAYCAKALESIDLCFMNTIDSFCQMILAEHPTEAGIPSDATILEEEEMMLIYEKEYIKLRSGEYGATLKKKADLFKSFYREDVETFTYGANYLMERRNVHFNYDQVTDEELDIDVYFSTYKQKLLHVLKVILPYVNTNHVTINNPNNSRWADLRNVIRVLSGTWSENLVWVMSALNFLQYNVTLGKEYNNPDMSVLAKDINAFGKFTGYSFEGTEMKKLDKIRYAITMDLLHSCVEKIEPQLKAAGSLSYFDYLYFLRNLLDEDAKKGGNLTRYIYDRHSYFFVDEFQDTNPMQAEILFHLTARDIKERWAECIPKPGSLFIVGDPKQSIYRFRGADVTSYLRVKSLFTNEVGQVLQLTKNFRSRKVLTTYFNRIFAKNMPEETANQCKYMDIDVQEDSYTDTPVLEGVYTYEAYTGDSLVRQFPQMSDAKQVSRLILQLVNNENHLIMDKSDKHPRKIQFKDIMLITYAKKNLPDMMNEFEKKNIPYRAEGKVLFQDCKSLICMRDLLQVFAKPTETIGLIKALYGSVLNITSNELIAFTTKYCQEGELSLYGTYDVPESDVSGTNIKKTLTKLRNIIEKTRTLTPASVFTLIMEEFEIFKYVSEDNLEILYYTLELIRSEQQSGRILMLSDCVKFMDTLLSGKSNQERCLNLKTDDDRVHIANLHKVKGLEAPIVILIYWYPVLSPIVNTYIDYTKDQPEGYLISCDKQIGDTKKVYFKTNQFQEQKNIEQENLFAEYERLVYVAATRPRNALIMCKSHSGWEGNISSEWCQRGRLFTVNGDYDTDIFESIEENETPYEKTVKNKTADSLYKVAQDDCVLSNRDIEESSFTVKCPSGLALNSVYSDDDSAIEVDFGITDEEHESIHKKANILGTSIHKLMEELVLSKGTIDVNALAKEIANEFVPKDSEDYKDALIKALLVVADKMTHGGYEQDNVLPANIYNEFLGADEFYAEVPFCYQDGEEVWNGIMDVIYCKDGKWHIVDYKTNAEGNNLDVEYEGQLAAYVKAFKFMTGEDADAHTYHIDI